MMNLIPLLVAAALVSQACAQIEDNNLDNNLKRNVAITPKRRGIRQFVNILEPPPDTARLVPGAKLELACEAAGHPAPSVQWLKNGEPLNDDDGSNEIIPIHPSSMARLTSKITLTATSSGDVYTCVASSGVKQKMASTTVYTGADDSIFTVQALFGDFRKATITEYYNEVFQDVGSTVVLICHTNSRTPAQVYWTFNNKPVFGDSKKKMLPSGDLLISNIQWEEMGNYSCNIKNMYGKETVDTFLYPIKTQ